MSKLVRKSHNVLILLYHYVCPVKYRRVVFDKNIDGMMKESCLEIEKRYEIEFIEIGTDKDHVHFLIQSVPMYSPKKIIQIVKSLIAKEIIKQAPEVKQKMWVGKFWSSGYDVNTVGRNGSEEVIRKYVKEQGQETEYQQLHSRQLKLFR